MFVYVFDLALVAQIKLSLLCSILVAIRLYRIRCNCCAVDVIYSLWSIIINLLHFGWFSDSLDCLIHCGLVSTSAFSPPCPDRSFQLPALFLLFWKCLPKYKLRGDVLACLFQPHQCQAFRIKFNHSVCRHSSSIPDCPLYVPRIDIVFVSVMYILYALPTWLVENPIMIISAL